MRINEIFILIPALLGLKGNLEMTLASRLSTAVSLVCVCVCVSVRVYVFCKRDCTPLLSQMLVT